MTETLPPIRDVASACAVLGLGVSAAELHGSLCGWIAGGAVAGDAWLGDVLVDPGLPRPEADSALGRLREVTVAQLEDRSFGFMLLMPDEAATLSERSGALFDWCRGFVGAFGLTSGQDPPLSDEGREALADLVKLSRAPAQDEGDQDDEDALVEIEEFVRVAALLLHGDCSLGPRHRGRLN